ncbi:MULTISPECIES: hypothetical protein [unclassified Methylobacterium]|uniref:hypothetical protein n=1 Tax=unclassified Methylobacterium TaxID=2615210 RepID=UPI000A4FA7F9|nr:MULTISPECIES: hypothetical protein [unclassified Methylobacterium]MCK2052662.1 hypothetical protein [Methylobacterium sp. 37f]
MTFFIGIAGPWFVIALLEMIALRRDSDLAAEGLAPAGASSFSVARSAYLA